MWVFTDRGFYSIVQKPGHSDLCVRCRCRADMEAFGYFVQRQPVIIEDDFSDYRYRMFVSREDVVRWLTAVVGTIHYPNFKERVRQTLGDLREQICMAVWGQMLRVQKKDRDDAAEFDRIMNVRPPNAL